MLQSSVCGLTGGLARPPGRCGAACSCGSWPARWRRRRARPAWCSSWRASCRRRPARWRCRCRTASSSARSAGRRGRRPVRRPARPGRPPCTRPGGGRRAPAAAGRRRRRRGAARGARRARSPACEPSRAPRSELSEPLACSRSRPGRARGGWRASRLQGLCLKKRARVRGGRAPLVCSGEQSKHERPNPLRCPGDVRCTASSRAAGTATQVSAGCAIAIVPLSQPWPCFTCCWTFAQRWASACPLMQHCAECALRQCVEQGMPGLVLSWLSWHALMPRTPEECCTPWLAGVVMAWACVSLTRSAQYGSQGLQWTPSGTSCAPWRRTSRATMPPLRWSAPMQRAR